MSRIVCLGASLEDIYLVDHDDLKSSKIGGAALLGKIMAGSKVDIDKLCFCVGGGGLNAAITMSRCGHEVVLMSNIVRDAAGDLIMGALDKESIDNSYMGMLSRGNTGASVVLLDSKSGERTILTYRGVSTKFSNFSEQDLENIQPDWLYITTLGGDLETLERFLIKAHEMKVKVMLNPGVLELKTPRKLTNLLNMVDVILMNKEEASKIVPGTTLTELVYHLGSLVPIALITDGGMGGIAAKLDSDEIYRFGIYEDVKVKDATGAGDAFGAGFLAEYSESGNFKKSLIFGSANSTAVVQKIGANTGALDGSETLHMMPMQKI